MYRVMVTVRDLLYSCASSRAVRDHQISRNETFLPYPLSHHYDETMGDRLLDWAIVVTVSVSSWELMWVCLPVLDQKRRKVIVILKLYSPNKSHVIHYYSLNNTIDSPSVLSYPHSKVRFQNVGSWETESALATADGEWHNIDAKTMRRREKH